MTSTVVPRTSTGSPVPGSIMSANNCSAASTSVQSTSSFAVITFFQLVTLPVEFDASRRAKVELVNLGILDRDEMPGVNQTLNAAALTYVAAFVSSLLYLLYLVSSASRRD